MPDNFHDQFTFALEDDPILTTKCNMTTFENAEKVGETLHKLASHMPCLGLAANQFSVTERVCVAKIDGVFKTFINPKIVRYTGKQISKSEGCLSFPDIRGDIPRFKSVEVEYLSADNERVLESFSGRNAIILQHEIDHLNGIRCVDLMQNKYRQLYGQRTVEQEVGKNDPCPCGSGKKYKKCCMV